MKLTGLLGLATAFMSSLCCTVPLLAFVVGATSTAGYWAWLEPLRPYTIALTIGALGWAWYQQLKPQKTMECACETTKTVFWQTKAFLSLITGIALLLLASPSYSNWFYPGKTLANQSISSDIQQVVYVTIKGMTCGGCEQHVKSEITKLKGIAATAISYPQGRAVVRFDPKQTSAAAIREAVSATGYQVTAVKIAPEL
ncbi:mercuric transport protein MerTP [Fibrella sp. WM1]|uniref:mercuric transport protein MerTP n=1 Tax=Fibrella musci TaxID=3242485 RepID=UPI00352207D5